MPFSASVVFGFTSSTSAKHFPLRIFFHVEKQQKVAWGEIGKIESVRHGGPAIFGQKVLNTQSGVGRYAGKSPIMK